jgi:hypothetical protein
MKNDRPIQKGRTLALWGAWMQLGPMLGMVLTVISMVGSFNEIRADGVPGSAEVLASDISLALNSTAIGILLGMVGLIFLLIALFSFRYRAPWFFWFMAIYSILCLPFLPVGTAVGILVLVYMIPRREEFSEHHSSTGGLRTADQALEEQLND